MKLCVIGNSHVGALKLAWDGLRAERRDLEVTFFAQRQGKILTLATEGRRLVPSSEEQRAQLEFTSGGLGVIDTRAYDAFLVYGLFHRPPLTEDGSPYSRAVREAATLDRATRSNAYRMVRRLRRITRRPIFVGLSPLRANIEGAPLPPPLLPYSEECDLLDRQVFAPLGARLVRQPPETVVDDRSTAVEFSPGSVKLDLGDLGVGARHGDRDDFHMNEAYGRLWLESLAADLANEGRAEGGVALGLAEVPGSVAAVSPGARPCA